MLTALTGRPAPFQPGPYVPPPQSSESSPQTTTDVRRVFSCYPKWHAFGSAFPDLPPPCNIPLAILPAMMIDVRSEVLPIRTTERTVPSIRPPTTLDPPAPANSTQLVPKPSVHSMPPVRNPLRRLTPEPTEKELRGAPRRHPSVPSSRSIDTEYMMKMSPPEQRKRGKNPRWTTTEEDLMFDLLEEVGHKWPVIADRLGTGRTPAGVEQHWQVLTGRRKRKRPEDIQEAQVHASRLLHQAEQAVANNALSGLKAQGFAPKVVANLERSATQAGLLSPSQNMPSKSFRTSKMADYGVANAMAGMKNSLGQSPRNSLGQSYRDDAPPKPKRPPTAYLIYSDSRRRELGDDDQIQRGRDVQERIGNEWRDMPKHEKIPWNAQYELLKAKYDAELKAHLVYMATVKESDTSTASSVDVDGSDVLSAPVLCQGNADRQLAFGSFREPLR